MSTRRTFFVVVVISLLITQLLTPFTVFADGTAQAIPFTQNWTNTNLITADDSWSGVPGIVGYRGDDLVSATGVNPQSVLADGAGTPVDVIANQTNPNTLTTGGVAEFEITNPTIALQGSGTADAPHIVISLDATGQSNINVSYNLRDIDGSADNAVQPVALQYRVGSSGNYTNIPEAYVADATTGPNQATLVTPVSVALPAAASNQPLVQLRIITTNAAGSDEWVGIDDINITGSGTSDSAPTVTATTPANNATNVELSANLTVTFSEPVNVASNAFTITSASGNRTVTVTGGPTVFTLDPDADFAPNEIYTVRVAADQVSDQDTNDPPDQMAADYTFSFTTTQAASACGETFTPIYEIQGSGASSPLVGSTVTTEGVVTGDFQGANNLNGFFLQDPTGDNDPNTSDGIFVLSNTEVKTGDRVRVRGTVGEDFTFTQIKNVSQVSVCGAATPIIPTAIDLPLNSTNDFERYEGMLLTIPETLTVTDTGNLSNFGELVLSANGRLYNTNNGQPNTGSNDVNRLILDDTQDGRPSVVPYLSGENTRRVGDTVNNLTGVLGFGFSHYRLRPTLAPEFVNANPRTAAPAEVGGNLKVSSFNVLNYFTTLNSRGANSAAEFSRQRAKIIAAIKAIDADIFGLTEIQNNGTTAISDLVAGLNAAYGESVYDFVVGPAPGTDLIQVAIIYKPARVTPVGAARNDTDPIHNRAPLAQTFQLNANGEKLTVVVNHFKSKSCGGASGADADSGQGCFNATRVKQAQALLTFVNTIPATSGDNDVLLLGDFNAYGEEDPIKTLEAAGFFSEVKRFVPLADRYSFNFDGQSGELDHVLVSSSLNTQTNDATIWHINADEPDFIDYNLEGKPPTPDYYTLTPFRSSDHDPVVTGFNLNSGPLNITDRVQVSRSGLIYSRISRTFNGTVTITNTGNDALSGSVQLVFDNLTSGVTLLNATGAKDGDPFITITLANPLAAGETVSIPVRFSNPLNNYIDYSPIVYAGSF